MSAVVTSGTTLAIQVATVLSGVILARGLGPGGRGDLAVSMQWPLLLVGVLSIGIPEAVTFFTARDSTRASAYLSASLLVAVVQVAVTFAVGLAIIPWVIGSDSLEARSGAITYLAIVPLYLPVTYLTCVLQGLGDSWSFNAARVAVIALNLGFLALLLVARSLTVQNALVASVLATAGAGLFTFELVRRHQVRPWRTSWPAAKDLIAFGLKLHVGMLAWQIVSRADVLVLGHFRPSAETGFYVAGAAAASMVALVPNSLALLLLREFARLDSASARRALALIITVGLPASVAALAAYMLVVPWIVEIAFGHEYQGAAQLGQVLAIASAARGFGLMLSNVLRGLGLPFETSVAEVIGGVVLIPLLFWSVPLFGSAGAAAAAAISGAVNLAVLLLYVLKHTRLTPGALLSLASRDVARVLR
jgi:O-antigen/teichoic acid export membrane protein